MYVLCGWDECNFPYFNRTVTVIVTRHVWYCTHYWKSKDWKFTTFSKSCMIFLLFYLYFPCVYVCGHVDICGWMGMCVRACGCTCVQRSEFDSEKHPDLPFTLLNVVVSQSNPEINNIICVACQLSLETPLLCFLKQKLQDDRHTHLTFIWILGMQTQFLALECKDFFFLTSKWFH